MRVFVTGASGFIGTPLVRELKEAGHDVIGLARSDASADSLAMLGAQVHRGDLEDLESLKAGAAKSDGVIHLGFVHDFSRFQEVCEIDGRAIEALGSVLAGSDRPLIVTSGTAGAVSDGRLSTEEDEPSSRMPRVSEQTALSLASQGVKPIVVRLPQVHDPLKQGLVTYLIAIAREKGISAYIGDGSNRWPAAHVLDVAHLYRLAFEKRDSGARYNAVDEEGVALKEIAESIGKGLNIPVVSKSTDEAAEHFGWLAMFAGSDIPASSKLTQERLGWHPTGPSLISDLDQAKY